MSTLKKYTIVLVFTVLIALILPFIKLDPVILFLAVAIIYVVIFAFLNNKIGLFFLILVRPCLDILGDKPVFNLGKTSVNLASFFGVLTLLFSFYVIAKGFKKLKRLPPFFYIFIFLGLTLASVYFSMSPGTSFVEWIRLLSVFALYLASFTLIENKKDLDTLIKVIIASAIVPGLFAFYQYFTGTGMTLPLEGIYNRIFGTFSHPNLFAYYLILPISLSVYLFWKEKNDIANLLFASFLPFFLILLLFTYTRGAWLAFIIIILFLGIFKSKKLLILMFLGLLLVYFGISSVRERVDNLTNSQYTSVNWRMDLWKDAVKYAEEKPIAGYGTGTATELILAKRGTRFGSTATHNDYLKVGLENGLLGLLAYLGIIISMLVNLKNEYFFAKSEELKKLILISIGFTIAIYAMSFGDNILRNTALQWSYFAFLGGLFAYIMKTKLKTINS